MIFDEEHRKMLSDFLMVIMREDNLTNNDVAIQLNGTSTHVSWLKNPSYWKLVPMRIWDALQKWYESETTVDKTKHKPAMEEEVHVQGIEIEHGIAIPEHVSKGSRYPLLQMEVGDSFKVPYTKSQASHLSGAVGHFHRSHPEYKFVIRTLREENIVRCWRTK